jgi:long-subunit fatty acid transport protein
MRMDAPDDDTFFDDVNRDIRDNLQAVVNTRVGLEYYLGNIALRGGFALQPDPRDVETLTADQDVLDRTRTFFSAGIGYRFNDQLELDFGWMQARYDDQYLPYVDVNDAPVVDEEVRHDRFAVGVRVFF